MSLLPVHTPAHTTFYSMDTGEFFPGGKAEETWNWPPTAI